MENSPNLNIEPNMNINQIIKSDTSDTSIIDMPSIKQNPETMFSFLLAQTKNILPDSPEEIEIKNQIPNNLGSEGTSYKHHLVSQSGGKTLSQSLQHTTPQTVQNITGSLQSSVNQKVPHQIPIQQPIKTFIPPTQQQMQTQQTVLRSKYKQPMQQQPMQQQIQPLQMQSQPIQSQQMQSQQMQSQPMQSQQMQSQPMQSQQMQSQPMQSQQMQNKKVTFKGNLEDGNQLNQNDNSNSNMDLEFIKISNYNIPKHTIYLGAVLILIGIALWYLTNDKKEKNEDKKKKRNQQEPRYHSRE